MWTVEGRHSFSILSFIFPLLVVTPLLGNYLPFSFDLGIWKLTASRLFLLMTVGFAAAFVLIRQEITITNVDVGICVLWIVLIGSVSWSVSPSTSITKADNLLLYLLFFGALLCLPKTTKTLYRLTGAILFSGFLLTAFGLAAFATGQLGDPILFDKVTRNQYSRHLLVVWPVMAAAAYLEDSSYRKASYLLTAGAMGTILLLAGSRSGIVAFFVLIYLMVVFSFIASEIVAPGTAIALSVLTPITGIKALAGLLRLGVLPNRYRNIPHTPSELFSPEILGPARYALRLRELELIRENWLFGIGYGGILARTSSVPFGDSYQAHSIITRFWLAAGIGAVVALGLIYLFVIRNYIRNIANSTRKLKIYGAGYFFGFIALSVAGFANVIVYDSLFYILLSIGSSLIPVLTKYDHGSETQTAIK